MELPERLRNNAIRLLTEYALDRGYTGHVAQEIADYLHEKEISGKNFDQIIEQGREYLDRRLGTKGI